MPKVWGDKLGGGSHVPSVGDGATDAAKAARLKPQAKKSHQETAVDSPLSGKVSDKPGLMAAGAPLGRGTAREPQWGKTSNGTARRCYYRYWTGVQVGYSNFEWCSTRQSFRMTASQIFERRRKKKKKSPET